MLFWILGILLLLVILICLLQIRIFAQVDSLCVVSLRIGPIKYQLYPGKETKTNQKAKDGSKKEKQSFPKLAFSDIKDAFRTLKPALIRTLHRTRRGIRIDPLDVSVILGGREDPAGTAEMYGYASAGIWTIMPVLEQLLVIPAPHIHLDMDFDAEKIRLVGTVGVRIRIGTLLLIVFGLAIPAIRWFLAYTKRTKQVKQTPSTQTAV